MYRDGVGEGQFKLVLMHEMKAIQDRIDSSSFTLHPLRLFFACSISKFMQKTFDIFSEFSWHFNFLCIFFYFCYCFHYSIYLNILSKSIFCHFRPFLKFIRIIFKNNFKKLRVGVCRILYFFFVNSIAGRLFGA